MLIAEYDYATDIEVQREEAMEEGFTKGKIEDRIDSILELLEDYGTVPEKILNQIHQEKNIDTLRKWHKLAARVNSIEEFVSQIQILTKSGTEN